VRDSLEPGLTPIILATQEAERSITVRSQPGQIVHEALSRKNEKRSGGVAQGVGPEFKPHIAKKEVRDDLKHPRSWWGREVCPI
jgi:hypothetical protein